MPAFHAHADDRRITKREKGKKGKREDIKIFLYLLLTQDIKLTPCVDIGLSRIYTAMTRKIQLEPLVARTIPLNDINDAFDLIDEGKSIRSVIRC